MRRYTSKIACWRCGRLWWTFEALIRCVHSHRSGEHG